MDLATVMNEDMGGYVNDLTREMDKHVLPGYPDFFNTYIWKDFEKDGVAIRYPGATRGHIEYTKDMVITGIHLYETATESCICCYKPSVHEAVKQFIGSKIILQEQGGVV